MGLTVGNAVPGVPTAMVIAAFGGRNAGDGVPYIYLWRVFL